MKRDKSKLFAQPQKHPEQRPAVHCVWPCQRPCHPLRVELDGNQGQGLVLHGLRHPVLRPGRPPQPLSQPPQALVVAAVHRERRALQTVEERALFRLDWVDEIAARLLMKWDQTRA